MDRGFAVREHAPGHEVTIRLTDAGRGFLREHGRIGASSVARVSVATPGAVGR
jgi:hypothetical protein